jgi:hypothetical protein
MESPFDRHSRFRQNSSVRLLGRGNNSMSLSENPSVGVFIGSVMSRLLTLRAQSCVRKSHCATWTAVGWSSIGSSQRSSSASGIVDAFAAIQIATSRTPSRASLRHFHFLQKGCRISRIFVTLLVPLFSSDRSFLAPRKSLRWLDRISINAGEPSLLRDRRMTTG